MGTLILLFDNSEAETFGADTEKDAIKLAKYWIRRRREKMNSTAYQGFYSETPIDTDSILAEIEEEEASYQRQMREAKDRAEYEHLKKKYEKPTTTKEGGK